MIALTPPISKSDAQRALVLADILDISSETILPRDEALPRDVLVLREGLRRLKAAGEEPVEIDCHDGGAPFRFLLTQAALSPGRVTRFTGSQRLGQRPHGPLVAALKTALEPQGLRIDEGNPWPLTVHAPNQLAPKTGFDITGVESSQFASSLLLGAARLVAKFGGPIAVHVHGPMTSEGYLALTCAWVRRAGFELTCDDGRMVVTRGTAVSHLQVPGDWSSLTYLLSLAWKSGAAVERADFAAAHPDAGFVTHLGSIGLAVHRGPLVTVTGVAQRGFTIDAEECPDAVPTLAAVAANIPFESVVNRVGILRHKESDRLDATRELLSNAGCQTTLHGETLRIMPAPLHDFTFDARDDHRMAMSAAVLAYLGGVRVALTGREAVAKSFPGFWGELGKVTSLSTVVSDEAQQPR